MQMQIFYKEYFMKKILAAAAAAVIGSAALFAFDIGEVKGTWQDSTWNANWTFSADSNGQGQIVLTDSKTGATYYTFNDSNIQNYKLNAGASGVTISFSCKDTGRSYKFTKPISLGKDLTLDIDRDWTTEAYSKTITWQGASAGAGDIKVNIPGASSEAK